MAFCLDLAPDHLRKILGSSIHTSPCLFSYDNKFCTVESSIAFCIMQLAGTVSIRAHLDADVKSSELVGAALQLIHRCWSKGLALQLREIDGCGCLEWQQWGLQTLRAMGSVSVAWHNVLAGHIGQAYIIALPVTLHASCRIATTTLGSYEVFFLRLSSLSCLLVFRLHAPLLAYQRSPPTLLARATHHGFWPGVLKRPSGPLPAENGTGAPRVQEYQFTTQTACAFHEQGLGATCAFVGQIATFVLVEVGLEFGCMLKYTMCCSPYTHGEWYLLDSTQLGAELLPLLLENMAFRLDLKLVQIQVVVQGLTFAVPLVSFLVDWPVGTVFIAVAFPSFEHMVEAHPVLVGSYFSRRLCIVNPPDGMLPLNLTIDPMLPVLMLQILIVQHLRQRSGYLESRAFVLCDEQGFVADTCTKIQTAFHEDARVLLKYKCLTFEGHLFRLVSASHSLL